MLATCKTCGSQLATTTITALLHDRDGSHIAVPITDPMFYAVARAARLADVAVNQPEQEQL